MFGNWFLTNRVFAKLGKLGWEPKDVPPHRLFWDICNALYDNGYDVDRIAQLWHRFRQNNGTALKEIKENTGIYGQIYFPD